VLTDAYLAAERQLATDATLRDAVINVVAGSQNSWPSALASFPVTEVASVANAWLAKRAVPQVRVVQQGEAFRWLQSHKQNIDRERLWERLRGWMEEEHQELLDELVYLSHSELDGVDLHALLPLDDLYQRSAPGPNHDDCSCLGEIALLGLGHHTSRARKKGVPVAVVGAALKAIYVVGKQLSSKTSLRYVDSLFRTSTRAAERQLAEGNSLRLPEISGMDKKPLGPEQLRIIIQGLDNIVDTLGPIVRLSSKDSQEDQQP
jgi:hypothetical protein